MNITDYEFEKKEDCEGSCIVVVTEISTGDETVGSGENELEAILNAMDQL